MICLQNKPGRASGPQAGRSITEDFYGIAFNHFEYIFSSFFFFFFTIQIQVKENFDIPYGYSISPDN